MLAADTTVRIREVRAGDEAAITRLINGLDTESRYMRWFTGAIDIRQAADWASHPERFCAVGLLAIAAGEPVGHAVLIPLADGRGEIAFEVAAPWRHHGIAGALLEQLLAVAAVRGLREVYADVLPDNADMLAVLREHGDHAESCDGSVKTVTLPVRPVTGSGAFEQPVVQRVPHELRAGRAAELLLDVRAVGLDRPDR